MQKSPSWAFLMLICWLSITWVEWNAHFFHSFFIFMQLWKLYQRDLKKNPSRFSRLVNRVIKYAVFQHYWDFLLDVISPVREQNVRSHLWWCRGRSSRPFLSRRRCVGWKPSPRTAVCWKAKQTRTFVLRPGKEPKRLERRFHLETKGSSVDFVPFIARLPVAYTQQSIHLRDSLPNYSCSIESLRWLPGHRSKHDWGWIHVARRPPALDDVHSIRCVVVWFPEVVRVRVGVGCLH